MDRDRKQKNRSPTTPFKTSKKRNAFHFDTLSPRDFKRVLEIERACFRHPWPEDSFHQILGPSPTFSYIATRTEDNTLAGYIIYNEVVDELHILNVAVHPDFQHQGIATLLLFRLHQEALTRGRTVAYLEVRETNLNAQKLYKKFGYQPVGKRKDYYSDTHEDAILMMTNLK